MTEIDHTHVDQGDLDDVEPIPLEVWEDLNRDFEPSERPTRKWWAARVTALTGWLIAFVDAGYEFTSSLVILLITLVSEGAISYLTSNDDTPGGVPEKE